MALASTRDLVVVVLSRTTADTLNSHKSLLKDLLLAYGELAPSPLEFAVTEQGKPYLAESKLHFNLSHNLSHTAIALCTAGAVGIDVETSKEDRSFQRISQRCFHARHRKHIVNPQQFYAHWVLKEAHLKCHSGTLFGTKPPHIRPTELGYRSDDLTTFMVYRLLNGDYLGLCLEATIKAPIVVFIDENCKALPPPERVTLLLDPSDTEQTVP